MPRKHLSQPTFMFGLMGSFVLVPESFLVSVPTLMKLAWDVRTLMVDESF